MLFYVYLFRFYFPKIRKLIIFSGFSHCGDIKYAEMKERGSGLIRFGNERDAERAICKYSLTFF